MNDDAPWTDQTSNVQSDGDSGPTAQQQAEDTGQQLEKKAELLESLMSKLDTVVHVEMAAIYYMDNSFLRLFIRLMIHYYGFILLFPRYKQIPYYGLIIASNILCGLLHILNARPEAGEATRGYLHGGLLLDFVGQKGPTSKLHLVVLDMTILLFQLLMLAVYVQLYQLRLGSSKPTASATAPAGHVFPTGQDHDAEERGVQRFGTSPGDDIELQQLSPHGQLAGPDHLGNGSGHGMDSGRASSDDTSWRGYATQQSGVYSGEMVLAHLGVADALRYLASHSALAGVAG